MFKFLIILLSLLVIGCDQITTPKYILHDGYAVKCNKVEFTACGVMLWECLNGAKYVCQNNVKIP